MTEAGEVVKGLMMYVDLIKFAAIQNPSTALAWCILILLVLQLERGSDG